MEYELRAGDWRDSLQDVEEVDTVIVDAPYSARTHNGHNDGATARGDMKTVRISKNGKRYVEGATKNSKESMRVINYTGWDRDDVESFVRSWAPRCRGWFVTITDHNLAPMWAEALEAEGRYVFAPLPWVAIGSRVRLSGDGPACWACWIIVARPRTGEDRSGRAFSKWGALPGAYVITRDSQSHIGGKPLALMEALVRDYTRPGDLVCDPCAGYGTTLAAAVRNGRRGIGSELDPETRALGLAFLDKRTRSVDMFASMSPTVYGADGQLEIGEV